MVYGPGSSSMTLGEDILKSWNALGTDSRNDREDPGVLPTLRAGLEVVETPGRILSIIPGISTQAFHDFEDASPRSHLMNFQT